MANEILLNKNRYATTNLATLDAQNLTNYNILLDKFKIKQKKYMTILLKFVEKYNEFINEKYADTKENWLMKVNTLDTTNTSIFDTSITDVNSLIELIENLLQQLESYYMRRYGLSDGNFLTIDIIGTKSSFFFYSASTKQLPGYYYKDIRSFKFLKYVGDKAECSETVNVHSLTDLPLTFNLTLVDKVDKR